MLSFFIVMLLFSNAYAADNDLGTYLSSFDYTERKAMKIDSKEAVDLLKADQAQLIDIRFKEEYEAWHMNAAINIPLNELSKRMGELDKRKIIITACPHKDRAIMARLLLTTNGFQSKYLKDGLIGLAEYLRGDEAKKLVKAIDQMSPSPADLVK